MRIVHFRKAIFVYLMPLFENVDETHTHGHNDRWRSYPLSPLQVKIVTKIVINMCPLSTDWAILILVYYLHNTSIVE